MRFRRLLSGLGALCLVCAVAAGSPPTPVGQGQNGPLEVMVMGMGPTAPADTSGSVVDVVPQAATTLSNVPTSTWTYGCSATSAGMIFGYYDRMGYSNMYAGSTNGGVAPLTNLGQGIGATPIAGSTSIIATQNGHDGRTTKGHVDDYWISTSSPGPDPWEGNWAEHTWADCTADYMGTNQWKWDFIGGDGVKDFNSDGSTALFSYSGSAKLFDYIPAASAGLPQTALCHGLRLFAESRGYTVYHDGANYQNYTQKIDTLYAGGFSFADYKAEIDAGRPVMIQISNHSMVGMGYDDSGTNQTVYLHDTWDNNMHTMAWGGSYAGRDHQGMTVIRLNTPTAQVTGALGFGSVIVGAAVAAKNVNVAETGGLTRLDYAIGASPAGFTVSGAGSAHFLNAGQNQNYSVTLNTASAGNYSGPVTVSSTAVNPTTLGSATASGQVLDHSEASFNGAADLDTLTLDFGSYTRGDTATPLSFSLFNLVGTAGLTAGLDLDLIAAAGDNTVLTTDLATFVDLAAGSSGAYQAYLDTSLAGLYNATYTLSVSDEDLPGAVAGNSLVLTLTGEVLEPAAAVPEPSSILFAGLATMGLLTVRRRRR